MPDKSRIEDIVVLLYSWHNLKIIPLSEISREDVGDFKFNPSNMTWSWENHLRRESYHGRIGDKRYCGNNHFGVIGVYDKTKILHLNAIVDAVEEERRDPRLDLDE